MNPTVARFDGKKWVLLSDFEHVLELGEQAVGDGDRAVRLQAINHRIDAAFVATESLRLQLDKLRERLQHDPPREPLSPLAFLSSCLLGAGFYLVLPYSRLLSPGGDLRWVGLGFVVLFAAYWAWWFRRTERS
jgi:hypothetical protein